MLEGITPHMTLKVCATRSSNNKNHKQNPLLINTMNIVKLYYCFLYLQAMQAAGVEGEQVYFILEDYQLINPEYLDLVNSLLSSGEV